MTCVTVGLSVPPYSQSVDRRPSLKRVAPAAHPRITGEERIDADQEEVYTLLFGRVTLRVGGVDHELEPGVFARVGAAEKRKLVTGDEPARVLAMGATPGRIYQPPEFSEEGATPPPMSKLKSKDATPA